MKTLIITAWGGIYDRDYAFSTAIALRATTNAEVNVITQSRLPAHLDGLKKAPYDRIYILGISLNHSHELLIPALKTLAKNNVKITWISALPLPGNQQELKKYMDVQYSKKDTLTAAVAMYFKSDCGDLLPLIHKRITSSEAFPVPASYALLIKATQFRYRLLYDHTAFIAALKTIAKNQTLTAEQKRMCLHYERYGDREFKGSSRAMRHLRSLIDTVAPKEISRILIRGETGTGKETVAVLLHEKSSRPREPFITFNCASSSTQLLESRLFGYVKGAFTGAAHDREGAFHHANGGTLFLDEIAELPLSIQANLLRVLQEDRFNRVGSVKEEKVDVRIIAATNRDVALMVREGTFREDLFYRLNVITLYVPPLRERPEDIADIAQDFWYKFHHRKLTQEQINVITSYHWPGNVRELKNFLERVHTLGDDAFAPQLEAYCRDVSPLTSAGDTLPENLEELTHLHVRRIYERYNGNKTHAAKALGICRNTLSKYLETS